MPGGQEELPVGLQREPWGERVGRAQRRAEPGRGEVPEEIGAGERARGHVAGLPEGIDARREDLDVELREHAEEHPSLADEVESIEEGLGLGEDREAHALALVGRELELVAYQAVPLERGAVADLAIIEVRRPVVELAEELPEIVELAGDVDLIAAADDEAADVGAAVVLQAHARFEEVPP